MNDNLAGPGMTDELEQIIQRHSGTPISEGRRRLDAFLISLGTSVIVAIIAIGLVVLFGGEREITTLEMIKMDAREHAARAVQGTSTRPYSHVSVDRFVGNLGGAMKVTGTINERSLSRHIKEEEWIVITSGFGAEPQFVQIGERVVFESDWFTKNRKGLGL